MDDLQLDNAEDIYRKKYHKQPSLLSRLPLKYLSLL